MKARKRWCGACEGWVKRCRHSLPDERSEADAPGWVPPVLRGPLPKYPPGDKRNRVEAPQMQKVPDYAEYPIDPDAAE